MTFRHGSEAADAAWAAWEAGLRTHFAGLGHSSDEIDRLIADRAAQSAANIAEQTAVSRHRNQRKDAARWARGAR